MEVSLYIGYPHLGAKLQVLTEIMNNLCLLDDRQQRPWGPASYLSSGSRDFFSNLPCIITLYAEIRIRKI
jgi:hypothetical protein